MTLLNGRKRPRDTNEISVQAAADAGLLIAGEDLHQVGFPARLSNGYDLIARRQQRVWARDSPHSVAEHADHEAAVRDRELTHGCPVSTAALHDTDLENVEVLAPQREQVHQRVLRHLVLNECQD